MNDWLEGWDIQPQHLQVASGESSLEFGDTDVWDAIDDAREGRLLEQRYRSGALTDVRPYSDYRQQR